MTTGGKSADDGVRERRAYDASGRRAAAEVRRARVVDVAAELFVANGWGGTTIAEVARLAEVSQELVAAAFGTKAGLLMVAFRKVSFGEHADLQEAFAAQRLDEEPDPAVRLDRFVAFSCDVLPRMAPFLRVVFAAAGADTAARERLDLARSMHGETCRELVELIAPGATALPGGPALVDEVYQLTQAEPYISLVLDRGWSTEQFGAWLRRSLVEAVARYR